MMYMVFLAYQYKRQGGSLRSFILSALGEDVEEDKTPCASTPGEHEKQDAAYQAAGSASDGGVSDRLLGSLQGDFDSFEIEKPLIRSSYSADAGGGTFSGSYQQLRGDEEEGEAGDSFLSINSDGFEGSVGVGSLSAKSDDLVAAGSEFTAPVTDHEVGGAKVPVLRNLFLPEKDRQVLKRRTIMERCTPLVLLSSFVSDLDLIMDWCFLEVGLATQGLLIRRIALFFAILGSVMWALSTTEFALTDRLIRICKNNSLSRLGYVGLGWQTLMNVFVEDVPQFIITEITTPTSVTGVLNLTTSAISLVAKIVEGIAKKRAQSLSTSFKMIDQDPAVSRNLFKYRDDAKKKAATAEELVQLAWTYRCSKGEAKAAAVFRVFQIDATFVGGDLEYMKADLFEGSRVHITACSLTGSIPAQLGRMTFLQAVVLSSNNLSGAIPAELGGLLSLVELNLRDNSLCGPIPVELCNLSSLQVLTLSQNMLSGEIPAGLGDLPALQELDLSHNQLTGPIPDELGNLTELQTLDVRSNMLSGDIPMTLGELYALRSLAVADNQLNGAAEAETSLKDQLHPECQTEFLPQQDEEAD